MVVADDDATLRLLMVEGLRDRGFEVEEATDGVEAVARVRASRPDLVILDLQMPRLDGFAACAQIRALPGGTAVPVLVLTSLDDQASIDRAFEVGATDFVTKPVHPVILEKRVRYLLRASRAFLELRRSERRLSAAQAIARLGHWEVDLETRAETWSAVALELLGFEAGEGPPDRQTLLQRFHPDDREQVERILSGASAGADQQGADVRVTMPEDQFRFVHLQGSILAADAEEQGRRLAVTVQDVNERKSAEERIRILAFYDGLTRLPNRQFFVESVTRDILVAGRRGESLAILFLDLDRFKRINDTLGHRIGDLLLVAVADRLRTLIRATDEMARNEIDDEVDNVARLGGDEFIVCLRSLAHREDAAIVARRILAALEQPFDLDGHEVCVAGSLGISVFPGDGQDVDELLKHADTAMYRAKADNPGGYAFFDPQMNATAFRRLCMESAIRRALAQDEFALHYQPQVETSTGRVLGFEALIRWTSDDFGVVAPIELVSTAEECGLIGAIGEWTIRAACVDAASWAAQGLDDFTVAVNVSAPQIQNGRIVEHVEIALRESGLDPRRLELEITEAVLMQSRTDTIEKLQRLRDRGVAIAIDDFGTGYSNLSYLKQLPVDRLKIDRRFVKDVVDEGPDAAIVAAILTMARGLGLGVVAEGVETQAQRIALRALGCTILQGFLFGRAEPAAEAQRRLEAGRTAAALASGRGRRDR